MALIEWMDMFSVGNAEMDADHKGLLDLLNRIYEAWSPDGAGDPVDVATVFDELTDYTRRHFVREEALLEKIGYDRLEVQKAEHHRMIEQLEAFRARHIAGTQPAALTQEMVDFLRTWMIDHILAEDMRYKPSFS